VKTVPTVGARAAWKQITVNEDAIPGICAAMLCTKSRFNAALQSANGAQCNSLGQRPRFTVSKVISAESAESARYEVYYALSALDLIELA